jgi:hypothetical protein
MIIGGLAAVAAVVGIAAAGPAHAYPFSGPEGDQDAGAYWVDVSSYLPGWTTAKDQQLAHMICTKFADGYSEGRLVAEVAADDSSSISGIAFVVHAAEWHFCPDYY